MSLLERCGTCRGPRGLHMTHGCVCAECTAPPGHYRRAETPCKKFSGKVAVATLFDILMALRKPELFAGSAMLGRIPW